MYAKNNNQNNALAKIVAQDVIVDKIDRVIGNLLQKLVMHACTASEVNMAKR